MEGMASVDPEVISMILEQLQAARMQDHQMLEEEQDDVLRTLMAQMGLLGVPTPEAGFAEGTDELMTPPPPDAGPASNPLAGIPPELLAGAGGAPMGDPMGGPMGAPAGNPLEAMTDEELIMMLSGGLG